MSFTVFDLRDLTKDKDKFTDWCFQNKLLIDYSSYNCKFCGSLFKLVQRSGSYSEGFHWQCDNRKCRKKISIKKGSFFELSKLSNEKIVQLTYFWVRNYPNQLASIESGISEHSIVDWFQFCRDVCVDLLDSELGLGRGSDIVGGPGVTVEIDESKFGKRKYNRGKHIDGVWVFGGIERDNKANCFFVVCKDCTADTLINLIKKYIRPGTHIVSDCWKSYNSIEDLGLGYTHDTVNHSKFFKDPNTGEHTNNIENSWLCIKKSKHGRGFNHDLLPSYFAEFIFRRKYLKQREDPFSIFIKEGICVLYSLQRAIPTIEKEQDKNKKRGKKKPFKTAENALPNQKQQPLLCQRTP